MKSDEKVEKDVRILNLKSSGEDITYEVGRNEE